MKTIKNLSVKVTYTVQYGGVEVQDDVYEQLMENEEFNMDDLTNSESKEFLRKNIEESDALTVIYEVFDIE